MSEGEVDSKCGICVGHSLHDVYKMLDEGGLQHRGQDACGIATITDNGIDIVRWLGSVRALSLDSVQSILDSGRMFMGEVRYSTNKAKGEQLFQGALPRFFGGRVTRSYGVKSAHPHMIVRGAEQAVVHNGHLIGVEPRGLDSDTDVMLRFYNQQSKNGVERIIETFPAAYAAAIMDVSKKCIDIFKDRKNIRPLFVGKKDGRLVVASEDNAIKKIGGDPFREVRPAEIISIYDTGTNLKSRVANVECENYPCFFEEAYLGHQQSCFRGVSNTHRRIRIGNEIARELIEKGLDREIDVVSFVPESPEPIARACADSLDKPFVKIFYKAKQVRSFLYGVQEDRVTSIGENLFTRDNVDVDGARVLLLEDSIVRGTNLPDAVRKAKSLGCSAVYAGIGTPPLGVVKGGVEHGCLFGIDMAPNDNFAIRRYRDLEEMAVEMGADWIYYLSSEGMEKAYRREGLKKLCTHCIGGPNPVRSEELKGLSAVVEEIYSKE